MSRSRPGWGRLGFLVAALLSGTGVYSTTLQETAEPLGAPSDYMQLREARLEPVGQIRNGRFRLDRVEFALTDGELYLLPAIGDRVTVAVFLGDGTVRCYPPDGVEHHMVKKFLDADFLELSFDRFVFWLDQREADRLRALADTSTLDDVEKAQEVLEDRREALLEDQLENPDSRLLVDRFAPGQVDASPRSYFYAQIDTDDHGWLTVEVEPREREEVRIYRFDRRRNVGDVWMGFHALSDFGKDVAASVFDGFPREPDADGGSDSSNGDWTADDLGLPRRPLAPAREGWAPRVSVPRTDVDLSLDGDGDARASVALLVHPHRPLRVLRLRVAPQVQVTDARWVRPLPDGLAEDTEVPLLDGPAREDGVPVDPEDPAALDGEPLHFIQETHRRWLADDRFEPWVTVLLPTEVSAGERFVVQLAYEGPLVDRHRSTSDFLLADTLFWIPMDLDSLDDEGSRLQLTFRTPERYRVASGTTLVEDVVTDDIRLMRWVTDEPVRGMGFAYGRFDVTTVAGDGPPAITLYENRNHLGFAPGNRDRTIRDLTGSISTYRDYFGPYPFRSLLVTETPGFGGQAFPGLVLLSFQTFGQLHTGESELFRAHEVAHQWWGAAVDWESYRDQWISEGFAQYAAAVYTQVGRGDEKRFLEMLDAWRLDVLGEVNVGQGLGIKHYGFRPAVIRRSEGHESGPIVAGYRLSWSESPIDYRLLVYEKGAFVLHMLRMMMTDLKTGDDEPFRGLMRQFAEDHGTQQASTSAFEAAVSRAFGEEMAWFFDQWVYGVEVPTYEPQLRVSRVRDQPLPFLLHGEITQTDVQDGFRMPVPIRVEFESAPPEVHHVWVDRERVEVAIPLPAQPSRVEFNYLHAVLAKTR